VRIAEKRWNQSGRAGFDLYRGSDKYAPLKLQPSRTSAGSLEHGSCPNAATDDQSLPHIPDKRRFVELATSRKKRLTDFIGNVRSSPDKVS